MTRGRQIADQSSERIRLQEIRRLEFASCSDVELRDTIEALSHDSRREACGDALETVFAVVNEAINRRHGAWRFFDPAMEQKSLQRYHELAERTSRTLDYDLAVGDWVGNGSRCWESFDRSVTPVLAHHGLEPTERILVGTILFVGHRSQAEYTANILLPACFYQALQAHDEDGVLAFEVTNEQILAGILLYQGKIVEMNAGEGKTIAAVFPAVLHAVHGRTVHVITANDYLAGRDADWLAPVYESLGLGVSSVLEIMDESARCFAYGKDIVYGALREFGFDFMRDNMKLSAAETVQRELDVLIVDEADHALIDEANIPLIIAGGPGATPKIPAKLRTAIEQLIDLQHAVVSAMELELEPVGSESKTNFQVLAKLYLADPESVVLQQMIAADSTNLRRVRRTIAMCRVDDEYDELTGDLFYWTDDEGKSLCLTEKGQDFVETRLGPLFDDRALQEQLNDVQANDDLTLSDRRREIDRLSRQLARRQDRMHQVVRMLWAYVLLKKDLDYLVRDDQLVLIDQNTGRGRPDTRYHYGLQAALEVKEGVPVQPEHEILGRISVRGFVSQYNNVSGMTGTAMSAKGEFERTYGLEVVAVPPSTPFKRTDLEPRMYFNKQDKLQAILEEARFCHRVGRPVLIGAHSIDESGAISQLLLRDGIEHNLLNAANDLEEDRIIQEAGLYGAVTVATDMAGRGTDIILEPGLDRQIADSYVGLLGELLAGEFGEVTLRCPAKGAAQVLLSAINMASLEYSITTSDYADRTDVIVSADNEIAGAGKVSLDFGLGLYVIGAGNSDNARVDHQLMGRSGRQGDFGVSRFFLSAEDRLMRLGGPSAEGSAEGLAGTRTDLAGRTFREGEPLTRHLEKLQKSVEKDAESRRARIEEYTRVLEAQSFAYYRTRQDILRMESFGPCLDRLVSGKAGQLVQKYFPALLVADYARQFAGLQEELDLDYQVAASSLWGLDLNLLQDEIAILIQARLERSREKFTGKEFDRLGKLLYLQTSDELWRDHMSQAQSLILSTQLLGHNGRGDIAAYTLTSFESYDDFRNRIIDSFLPRLAAFPSELAGDTKPPQVELFEDVIRILG